MIFDELSGEHRASHSGYKSNSEFSGAGAWSEDQNGSLPDAAAEWAFQRFSDVRLGDSVFFREALQRIIGVAQQALPDVVVGHFGFLRIVAGKARANAWRSAPE
jgi:hypothetical protein